MDDFTSEAAVRTEILAMCVEALRPRFPAIAVDLIERDARYAAACLTLLRDCRPIAVIRNLIDELQEVCAPPSPTSR